MTPPPAIAFSHVGVTVPDLQAALAWYRDVLGYYVLAGPIEVIEDDTPLGLAAARIYGAGFRRFRFAHLAGPDGSGLELFTFDSPPTVAPEDNFEFWKTGIYHFSLTCAEPVGLASLIAASGGRQRSEAVVLDATRGFSILYAEDPWGTVIEICSHPYPQMWG